jgi:hypothetical protein
MTQLSLRWTEVLVCGGALCGVVVVVAGGGVSRQRRWCWPDGRADQGGQWLRSSWRMGVI